MFRPSKSLSLWPRRTDGQQRERRLRLRQLEGASHGVVLEGANNHGAEAEHLSLQVNVLRDVPRLDVHIALCANAVLSRGARVERNDDKHCRSLGPRGVSERRLAELAAPIAGEMHAKRVLLRAVSVHARRKNIDAACYQIDFERVKGARPRRRALAGRRGDALRCPQELTRGREDNEDAPNSRTERRFRRIASNDAVPSTLASG